MAIKNNIKFKNLSLITVFLLLFIALCPNGAKAAVKSAKATVINDVNGDGIAGIGDDVQFWCQCTGTNPYVDLTPLGGALTQMTDAGIPGMYSANLRIKRGHIDQTCQLSFSDSDNLPTNVVVSIDNQPPNSAHGVEISGNTGKGNMFKLGDNLNISITLDKDDEDVVIADVSSVMGYSQFITLNKNNKTHTAKIAIPSELEATSSNITLWLTDNAGNQAAYSKQISYDTIAPVITAGIANNTTSNKPWAEGNDTIRVTASLESYDNDNLIIEPSDSSLSGSFLPKKMTKTAGSLGHMANFSVDIFVSPEMAEDVINNGNGLLSFKITATDKANNETQYTTNAVRFNKVDNINSKVEIVHNHSINGTNNAVIGDLLKFTCVLSEPDTSVMVTVDLSGIGGLENQILTAADYKNFEYTYTITQGSSENTMPRYFKARVSNTSSHSAQTILMPVIYVDNKPPKISEAKVTNLTANSMPIKLGDKVSIEAKITDIDNGSASVDLTQLGGLANTPLAETSRGRFGAVITAGALGTAPTDTIVSLKIIVTDDMGNSDYAAAVCSVDTEAPKILIATYTSPDISPAHPYAKIGDSIKFMVQLASSALNIHDEERVFVNCSEIGYGSNEELTYGGGWYSKSFQIKEGSLNSGAETYFAVTAVDNAGNKVSSNISAPIDNCLVKVLSHSYTLYADTNGNGAVDLDGTYITDSPAYATDTVNLYYLLSDDASVTVDLSKFGLTSAVEIPVVLDAGGYKAELQFQPKKGVTNGEAVKVKAYIKDASGNLTVDTTPNSLVVDNKPPEITNAQISIVVDTIKPNEVNKGDKITVTATVTGNEGLVLLDLTRLFHESSLDPLESEILMQPQSTGSHVYQGSWVAPAGLSSKTALDIIARDSRGNLSCATTNKVRFLSKTPTISEAKVELLKDINNNGIVNPNDVLRFSCKISDAFDSNNTPPASIAVNIAPISNVPSTETTYAYLKYNKAGGPPYFYSCEITASGTFYENRGTDDAQCDFKFDVLHPETSNFIISSAVAGAEFAFDTRIPQIGSVRMQIDEENGDNTASDTANIGDIIRIETEIKNYPDEASASAVIYCPTGPGVLPPPMTHVRLTRVSGTNKYMGITRVATGTVDAADPRELYPGEWRKADVTGLTPIAMVSVAATDDADNTASSTPKTPATGIKIDNNPLEITSYTAKQKDENNDGAIYKAVNIQNYNATDTITFSVTVASPEPKATAWADLTELNATSTYMLKPNGVGSQFKTDNTKHFPELYAPFRPQHEFEIASETFEGFRVYVKDTAGNISYKDDTSKTLAIDTIKPELIAAYYDGSLLRMEFSERINPASFSVDAILIGNQRNLTDAYRFSNTGIKLNKADIIGPSYPSETIYVNLASESRSVVAGWGSSPLYLSLSKTDTEPWVDTTKQNGFIATDIHGNWLKPVSRVLPEKIVITNDYSQRVNLVGGFYDASNPSENQYLYLQFDKIIDRTTINNDTLKNLAIWHNRSNAADNYSNRYRFIQTVASDTYDKTHINAQEVRIKLSQTAQDWVAIYFGNNNSEKSQMFLQLNSRETETPLLVDIEGNRVKPVAFNKAVPAEITNYRSQPAIQSVSLNLQAAQPQLTVSFAANSTDILPRMRLYEDPIYRALINKCEIGKTMPIDLSRVSISAKADLGDASKYAVLNEAMVDYQQYKALNPDYASNTIKIPLTKMGMKTILSWGTSMFYLAASEGAFRDLWGNLSEKYPSGGVTAQEIVPVILPITPGLTDVTIRSLAVKPTSTPAKMANAEMQLFKGYSEGVFYYDVVFDTPSTTSGYNIPVDRTSTPILTLYAQSDAARATPIDTAAFVEWRDKTEGSVVRTCARFKNNTDLSANTAYQKKPCYVYVENLRNIFSPVNAVCTAEASMSYKIENESANETGYKGASYTLVLDTKAPSVKTITGTGTIGITPVGAKKVNVEFSEPMNQTKSSEFYPRLRLGSEEATVMNFNFSSWQNATTAVFINAAPFSSNTPQGEYAFYVSGGFDEAGNRCKDNSDTEDGKLEIHSKGPAVTLITVETIQSTTAKDITEILTNKPFSPYIAPCVATIAINFETEPENTKLWVHLCEGNTTIASLPVNMQLPTVGVASWSGLVKGGPLGKIGPKTYSVRVYDENNNEGSRRSQIIYDGQDPKINKWKLENVKMLGNTAYFSPEVSSSVQIKAIGGGSNEEIIKMRLTNGTATETFVMGKTPDGCQISYDGKDSDGKTMPDGLYEIYLADAAGNLGQATAALFIDTQAPKDIQITARLDNPDAEPVKSYNPNTGKKLCFVIGTTDASISSGSAYVSIKAGSKVVKEIMLEGGAGLPLKALWNGKDSDNNLVGDGIYCISLSDLAGNEAKEAPLEIAVNTSEFKAAGALQKSPKTLNLTFTHYVFKDDAENKLNYNVAPAINIISAEASGAAVLLTFDESFKDGCEYTIEANTNIKSADGVELNKAAVFTFTADTKGPSIDKITFDGVKKQNEFNLVFNEAVNKGAENAINYTVKGPNGNIIEVLSAYLRSQNDKSVRITCKQDIESDLAYTISAKNVEDLFGNKCGNDEKTFNGVDITPPTLTISAFSNPANEFDMNLAVSANEELEGIPTAIVTQSGAAARQVVLKQSGIPTMFIGGLHLDAGCPGAAVIKVSAADKAKNAANSTKNFSVAYVNAALRTTLRSADGGFEVTFNPNSLSKSSNVSIVEERLTKLASSASGLKASIVPTALVGAPKSLRASISGKSAFTGQNDEELEPISLAYTLNIPAGRLKKSLKASMKVDAKLLTQGSGLYRSCSRGWAPVEYETEGDKLLFKAEKEGTYALMKDIKAPRASLVEKLDINKPIVAKQPVFTWNLEELASGLNTADARAYINNREYPLLINPSGTQAKLMLNDGLVSGEYSLGLRLSDLAGNNTMFKAVRFAISAPLEVYQVMSYPNPARKGQKVCIRFLTNSTKLNGDSINVKIYDAAGHKVADNRNVAFKGQTNNGTRAWQNVEWNLRNRAGKLVSNGVYFAKIKVYDPADSKNSKKVICKIAVLR